MIRCPRCNAQFVPDSTAADLASSPPDETPLDDSTDWLPVARTSSIAEAGFLCDLLVDVQINAQLQELDDFDAVSGAWHKVFVVVVPQVQSGQAAERLRREMDGSADVEDFDEEPSYEPTRRHPDVSHSIEQDNVDRPVGVTRGSHVPEDFFLETSRGRGQTTAPWLPVAMALVAGGAVYWMASDWLAGDGQAGHPTKQSLLWNALKETDASWTTSPLGELRPGGTASRTLRYDAASDVFVLEEDLDGDQRVDRRREFRRDAGWRR